MSSPARTRLSPPSWGARTLVFASDRTLAAEARRRAARTRGPGVKSVARLARRVARAVTPDVAAGVVLLLGWTLLWILFLVGILEPAAALRLVR